ncbi:hypothetical protein JP0053_14750 [Helicobacter pylori]|nr:hypothetical protein JP0053_14750 [Helicobacter pylori]
MYQLDIKTLGQVFTPKNIVDFMLTLKHNHGSVLEPSAGDGSFLKRLKKAVGIEIDPKICPKNALCMDFFDYPLENQFDTIKGILYFLNQSYTQKLSEVFKVKVGAVSGCDKIFKNEKYGNLEFVTSITKRTNVLEKMVFVNEPNDYLLQHKDSLMQRKIKKFNENNWFEWGRMHHISPKKRIYVNTKTRQKNPFFIHQCPNYDGSILALFPYNQNLDLQNLCDKLNAINWQELGFVCDGRFLFSQRSLENALLPKDFFN